MKSQRYLDLLDQMKDLHARKNAGYTGDNLRVSNLMKNPDFDQVGENVKDTLFDLAAYALIAICLLEEKETK